MIRNDKSRRCTLQDIADRTGYTVNTVSRALKNKSDISAATREYIRQAADEMGYIRNQMASSLRSGHTKTLGVVVGGMSNPYYGVMTDAIQNVAAEYGYSLFIFCSRDNPELELQVVETAISRAVEALKYRDASLAKLLQEKDHEIDQKERAIESSCLKLLLQQQPVARDLREISTALKMITDLERIGDHVTNVAECVINYLG